MRIATPLLTLLSLPAFAGDYRSLDIGDSCENVAVQETKLGSKPIEWHVKDMPILAFEGVAFDRRLIFTYFCPNGALLAGDYYLPSEPPSDAVESYEAVHKNLSAIYGAPAIDNTPWMQPAVDPQWLERDPQRYMTIWRTTRVSVTTIFLPSQNDEPAGWRVAVHFGGVK
jgi:hypothetical protein